MLMADIGGTPLHRVPDVTRWEGALRLYAETQIELTGSLAELDAVGCPRRTLDALTNEIDPLLADTDALTLAGAEPGLSGAEMTRLRGLAPLLKAGCRALADYRVPQTLTHGDVAVDIMARADGYVFFDWTYSSLAHPFYDLEFVFPEPVPGGPTDFHAMPTAPDTRAQLTDAYLTPWTVYEPMARLRQAVDLARPLGALHYAVTFHRYVVPGAEDAAVWRPSVPSLLRGVLKHEAGLSATARAPNRVC
ncbi:phosphotransferase [Candidatus Poribacteria bacterium]|nr:phosphotransferase [Candidatus Poribacteria bacterium]